METQTLDTKIEAILFYKGEPIKIKKLAELLSVEQNTISESLEKLKIKLQDRGVSLVFKEDEVVLVTNPAVSEIIQSIRKEELSKSLSKSALETLAIIIYRGPIKRSQIDHIRGVNSQFIIRLLLVRGLIEKITDPKDERSYLYKPTVELISMLGLEKITDIPEFEKVNSEIDAFVSSDKTTSENDNE